MESKNRIPTKDSAPGVGLVSIPSFCEFEWSKYLLYYYASILFNFAYIIFYSFLHHYNID
ncbi:MAG: hypothetical protein MRJ93_10470 [Nitrososphaeraceae archaeon]|nr:hypothetical protein [Nitrososphaeraceae archaeon]